MSLITAVLTTGSPALEGGLLAQLASAEIVAEILVARASSSEPPLNPEAETKTRTVDAELSSGRGLQKIIEECRTEFLLLFPGNEDVVLGQRSLERMTSVARDCDVALVYADFRDQLPDQVVEHPVIDYQEGSIRDSFDFGPMLLVSRDAAKRVLKEFGAADFVRWGSLYDLRLKLSEKEKIVRIPEPLSSRIPFDRRATGEKQFDYVDPRQRDYQIEMEQVGTEHLKRIGAWLPPEFETIKSENAAFPVKASIVIPVRNREGTIKDAVQSALSQKTSFDSNVIVVDNHSTDRTTEILKNVGAGDSKLVHITPDRTDLGIGGCWNHAIYSGHCGKYAVQLDSDDLYANDNVLQRVVEELDRGYAMVVGSYTIVDFNLREIPPGLIDHREWTRENGRNNALRINGLGAPRAFYVPAVREIGFPNTSYGEDYAVALKLSRRYEIGRIFDSIYFARRWEGNSDAALPLATSNRYDAYKDHIRTVEIAARRRMNKQ